MAPCRWPLSCLAGAAGSRWAAWLLGPGGRRPRGRADLDQACGQLTLALVTECGPAVRGQGRHIGPSRADAQREGLPPLIEARVMDPDGQRGDLYPAEPGLGEETGQMTFAGPGSAGLIVSLRIQLANCGPERGQRAAGARVIPYARADHSAGPGDPGHFPQAQHWIRHEVNDQLRHGAIESVIRERQLLGRALPDVHLRQPGPYRGGTRC